MRATITPARLACVDIGITIGGGADGATESADIVLFRDDLDGVLLIIDLATAMTRTVRGNVLLALGYTIAAIPIAVAGSLSPLGAVASRALSVLLVVANSLRLKRFGDSHGDADQRRHVRKRMMRQHAESADTVGAVCR